MQKSFPHFAKPLAALALVAALGLLLGGCAFWRPVTVPLVTIREPAPCATRPDTLLVMLPGSYSWPRDFVEEGFVTALRERGIAADVLLVDAHVGYYRDRSIIDRLQADVIAPARAQGYRQIWLVGISIGAFGSLIYSAEQPEGITGVVAIGPYLGQPETTAEIAGQGGLRSWHAPVGPLDPNDIDHILWRWLQPYASAPRPANRPELFLGFGRSDRFAESDKLLAAALPTDHVYTAEGGHTWAPWLATWKEMLGTMPLPRDPSCKTRP